MNISKSVQRGALFLLIGAGLAAPVHAESAREWPTRTITWVVGYAAGGTTDIVARAIANKVSQNLGQTVVVMNRPGANSNIGAQAVKRADPDGYTYYVGSAANAINRTLYENAGYDIVQDFAPVALFVSVPNMLVVNPALPIKSVADYIAYAKAHPGKLTCGSSGTGSSIHLSCELFKMRTGTSIMHVPFTGSGPAMTALLGGQVDSVFDNMPTVKPNVDAGKLRALGVTSAKRSPSAKDVPTIGESGVSDYAVSAWFGLFAPAATDKEIVAKMNRAVNAALKDDEIRNILVQRGADVPEGANTPADFGQHVKREVDKWATVVKAAGAKVN
ncbi:tripartite-type tricarboxylate transporter receptor subunit TctC [Cupriavidus gilardii J11]|uniref:Tripartite-type tricarboxylate transporter receptor subunit TctC n=1 Tax=Cupriavidus gilardii J11 TaxID=936133 RepID=A0A562B9J7_9BURK|nr:tripartite tricarboxylate transporter substrate binding protein [Cupriavidus gilardii]TWG81865.1 tripartite-type tricarboxylate transporter receptor subunit TctC [Cupriavidus gilardii J11]